MTMPRGYLAISALVRKPAGLIPGNIKLGENVAGITGEYDPKPETEEVSLPADFFDGDMIVEPSEGKYLAKVTIGQPDTLIPENIADGVEVAGIVGTHKGGGSGDLPQLFKPSIPTTAIIEGLLRISVYQNLDNGDFPKKVQIVSEDGTQIFAESEESIGSGYAYFYAYNFTKRPKNMPFKVTARQVAEKFLPSETSPISKTLFLVSILKDLLHCGLSVNYPWLFSGDQLICRIVPDSGYYYPKQLIIEPADGEIVYTYDAKTGDVVIPAMPQTDHIRITAEAPDAPWLETPGVSFAGATLTIDPVDNVTHYQIHINDQLVMTMEVPTATPTSSARVEEVSGSTYGFSLTSDGYYTSGNKGISNSYAMCKLVIDAAADLNLQLAYINYAEANYDFGILSTLDKTLVMSNTADSSNVALSCKGASSSSVKYFTYSVPKGEHFVYIKFRKDGSGNSNNDTFKFKVYSITHTGTVKPVPAVAVVDLTEYLGSYGAYRITVTAVADGFTDSDTVEVLVDYKPILDVADGVLTVSNLLASVTSVNVVVDGEQLAALEHDGSGAVTLDLSAYSLSIARHTLYVDAVMADGSTCRSDVVDDEVLFVYSSFNDASWEEVALVSRSGLAKKLYAVGQTKTLALGSTSLTVAVAGFAHDDLADGTGKAGMTIVTMNVPSTSVPWARSNARYEYGMENCYVTYQLDNWYTASIPAALRENIREVAKVVDAGYSTGSTSMKTVNCKLFSLSYTELGFDHSSSSDTRILEVGRRYELFPFSTKMPIMQQVGTTTARAYWARNIRRVGVYNAGYVATDGGWDDEQSSALQSTYNYIRFGFCL